MSASLLLRFCTFFADQKDRGLWERDCSFLVTLIESCAHGHLIAKQRILRNTSQKAASPARVTQETFCNRHRNLSKLKICGSQKFLTFRIFTHKFRRNNLPNTKKKSGQNKPEMQKQSCRINNTYIREICKKKVRFLKFICSANEFCDIAMGNLRKIIQTRHYERHFSCKGDLVYLTDMIFW